MIGIIWYIHHIIGTSHIFIFPLFGTNTIQKYNIHNILYIFHMAYYSMDLIHQVMGEKNLGYIVHHIISFHQINMVRSIENIETQALCNECFGFLELNSLLLLFREDLKEKKLLTNDTDLVMYVTYLITRGFMFPIYIYYMSYSIPVYLPIMLYLMSMKWLYDWTKSLTKRIKNEKTV